MKDKISLSSDNGFSLFYSGLKMVLVILALLVFFINHNGVLLAQTCNSKDDCEKKIEEYEKKISELKEQRGTLTSEITRMDTQIHLTSVKIENTNQLIKITQKEIETLTEKINDLNSSLDHLTKILLLKIIESYKEHKISPLELALESNNAPALFNRIKYIRSAQKSDQVLAFRLQQAKFSFEEQKTTREEKKQELEQLELSLDKQKKDLDEQKGQKQQILTQTRLDETKYQQLLEQALAEFEAIQKAIETGKAVGPVKEGDPIGLVGNSGYPDCSTGAHLHFEVRRNNQWTNPMEFLSPKQIGSDTFGSGGWRWPLEDPIIITQQFGQTPYSWRYAYSGYIHTGIDMISNSSDVIRAPKDGTLYTPTQNCRNSTINVKYIDHGDGTVSFYLHLR